MTTYIEDCSLLGQECRYLYFFFFKKTPPPCLVQGYIQAHKELSSLRDFPAREYATIQKILEKRLNATAIEPWLRRKGERHVLTRKLMLISFLAECGGGHEEFSRQAQGRVRGWWALVLGALQGTGALAVGYAEKTFYGLV